MAVADKAQKKKQQAQQRRLRRRARRDVRGAYAPQLAGIARQEAQDQAQAEQYQSAIAQLYSALGSQLGTLQPAYAQQMAGIQGNYQSALGDLTGLLGSTAPAGELAASAGLLGNIGAGGLELLASQAARNAAYGTSAERQSAIDSTNYQANILQALQNALTDLASQRSDIFAAMPQQVLSRLDQLRDTAAQLGLARKEYQLRKEATESQIGNDQALADYVNAQASNWGGGGGGGGGRGGGAGGGTAAVGGSLGGQVVSPTVSVDTLLKRFTTGKVSWADLAKPKRQTIRKNIVPYVRQNNMALSWRSEHPGLSPEDLRRGLINLFKGWG
jgi:hypothetical protein